MLRPKPRPARLLPVLLPSRKPVPRLKPPLRLRPVPKRLLLLRRRPPRRWSTRQRRLPATLLPAVPRPRPVLPPKWLL